MTDRERLIELLKGAETKVNEVLSVPLALDEWLSIYADHLLANGVIVSPFAVGQTVYIIDDEVDYGEDYVLDVKVSAVGKEVGGVWATLELPLGFKRSAYVGAFEVGKTVFLTKEDAEQALKERVVE